MNTVIPSQVEESRYVTLTPRGPSTALRFAQDDN